MIERVRYIRQTINYGARGYRLGLSMNQPLTRNEFNRQVEVLFTAHSASAFAMVAGADPVCTLFVDGEQVVAEPQDSPRYRYGAFCELDRDRNLDGSALDDYVWQWLRGGEAYTLYLSMNVCRYGC